MKRLVLRVIVALFAAVAAAFVSAVALAIADLYLVGHGHAGIHTEIIAWGTSIHLGAGDLILIAAVLLAAAGAWTLFGLKR